ncbi:2,3-bisphosphoglycerate-independent phosphoglycerate mutase [Phaeocystidibacter marisrubri]|uniref:2,3-bisphosphoglycerate-independent phosphoglycerate mutase n=1 Tax=Phaeocystidibacter marisrubri TaxID=1577780 RepID=A0A6L3ZE65_9FLAO|nr:2,3-bisphosphoglycerate-independent phosphoglycerate mutase [Phaeocystidibacter marisrubri]KAB2815734.1 2,3-bisphosphoglycerate-independent phosphoglycerate mutase [Phaeocystidibacter marisrubri]GGH65434.1 2,3-bisphosphoglycerate-independent phosphoglycerate mutase [Phaeocystidibacter marisrubri]
MLMILDGWGIAKDPSVSAIDKANTPFVDSLYTKYPNNRIEASSLDVGLPEGQMGNSEVGHMNLGAGRVVFQDLVRINNEVDNGGLAANPELIAAFEHAEQHQSKVHLIGLLSDGGVHSHIKHLKGLLSAASERGLHKVFVHAFTDGRDTDPKGGKKYVEELENHMAKTTGHIASIVGRYFAMDRDNRWERVKKAYDLMVHGTGESYAMPAKALEDSYANGVTDEFIEPVVITRSGQPLATIGPNDVVICFNFRTDRGRQITQALTQRAFPEQNMEPLDIYYVTMARYDDTFKGVHVLYEKENLTETLGEVLEKAGKKQIRIAETEKYPHVTFFFSGGRETEFEGEKRLLCPSPKVATYDLQPEMSAADIRDAILPELESGEADFICLNFANPDMVGHTGSMEAAIKACETVDSCAQAVVEAGLKNDYTFIILADHGNADCMINPDGSPNTAHTTQPVPVFLVGNDVDSYKLSTGKLGDIAPTLLELMQIEQPSAMTGKSLISK